MTWSTLVVEIAFDSTPLDDTPTWTDVTADVESITVHRGKSAELARFQPGVATIQFDNTARKYDPLHTSGPYYGKLLPRKQVRIHAYESTVLKRINLFSGFIQPRGWQYTYSHPGQARATVTCFDQFGILGSFELAELADGQHAGDLAGTRVGRVLDQVGIPNGWRQIDTGLTVFQGTTFGANALDYLHRCAESEGGALYCDNDGLLVFDDRHAVISDSRMTTSQATFDDTTTTLNFDSIEIEETEIYNRARVNRDGGGTQEYADTTSITNHTEQTRQLSNLLMRNDPEAYARAEWIVKQHKDPLFAPRRISFDAARSTALLDQALYRELRDRITVKYTPPGGGTQIVEECFIDSITHTIPVADRPNVWIVQWGLSSAERFGFTAFTNFLTLDTDTWKDSAPYSVWAF